MIAQSIRQLPPDVIGQIAAGEVVERPAVAIKELVENSMDAGATAITVDIKEGGLASFRVSDNGSGIRPEDIKLAFARHATSKIRTADDLYGVKSLGFRGEALASIAAVSRLTCQTRARGQESGISVRNEGGEILEIRDAACPEGTTFTVKDLFFNAPVRRKFLKKPATETAHVSDLMARLILSHPSISFRFMADGKLIYFSAGDSKLESAVMSVYGMPTLKLLTKVEGNMNGLLLSGYVGVGDAGRGNRSHQHFFLNGRAMKSGILSAAVETACRQRVTIGRFPMCVLHLDMPFELADVNVHPNKWEVRFQDERGVRQAVETIIFETLEKTNLSPTLPPLYLENKPESIPAPVKVQVTEISESKGQAAPPSPSFNPPAPKKEMRMSAFGLENTPLPAFTPSETAIPHQRDTSRPAALREAALAPRMVPQVPSIPPSISRHSSLQPQEKMETIPAAPAVSILPMEQEPQQIQDALVEQQFA